MSQPPKPDPVQARIESAIENALHHVPLPPKDGMADAQVSRERWEHRAMAQLMDHFNLASAKPTVARLVQDRTRVRRLSFDVFKELYPSFPMWLSFWKIPYLHDTDLGIDFAKPATLRKNKIFRAFGEAEAAAPAFYQEDGASGIVFEWIRRGTGYILHNGRAHTRRAEGEEYGEHLYHFREQTVVFQTFSSFLKSLTWHQHPDEQ